MARRTRRARPLPPRAELPSIDRRQGERAQVSLGSSFLRAGSREGSPRAKNERRNSSARAGRAYAKSRKGAWGSERPRLTASEVKQRFRRGRLGELGWLRFIFFAPPRTSLSGWGRLIFSEAVRQVHVADGTDQHCLGENAILRRVLHPGILHRVEDVGLVDALG